MWGTFCNIYSPKSSTKKTKSSNSKDKNTKK